jgi:hypothetical protein
VRRLLGLGAAVLLGLGAAAILGAYALRGLAPVLAGVVAGGAVGTPVRRLCPGDLALATAAAVCGAGGVALGTWLAFAHRFSQFGTGSWAGIATGGVAAFVLVAAGTGAGREASGGK